MKPHDRLVPKLKASLIYFLKYMDDLLVCVTMLLDTLTPTRRASNSNDTHLCRSSISQGRILKFSVRV